MAETNKKILFALKNKVNKMNSEELRTYVNKFNLEVPTEITDEFILNLYSNIQKTSTQNIPKLKRFKSYEYGLRSLTAPNHWIKNLQDSDFRISKPILICLPGNGTIAKNNDGKENGFCKVIETIIGLNHETNPTHSSFEKIDILGVSYGTNNEKETAGTMNEEECENFVNNLFMPLCKNAENSPLNIKEICTNMSLITFCTHCYGAEALENIMKTFSNKLKELNFNNDEIKLIKSHMCQITYSPVVNSAPVPTVSIDSMTDSFNKKLAKDFEKAYEYKLNGVAIKHDKPGTFRNAQSDDPDSFEILHIYSSRLINVESNRDMSNLLDEHTIEYLIREKNWELTEMARGAQNANLVSMLMAYSIAYITNKSIKAHQTNEPQPKTNLNQTPEDKNLPAPDTSLEFNLNGICTTFSPNVLTI